MESVVPASLASVVQSDAVPVAIVEALDHHGRVQATHKFLGVDATCIVGRDLRCDLVLNDTFVAAQHIKLALQADGRIAAIDLGSTNPTQLQLARGNKTLNAYSVEMIEDGVLIVGSTRLRVRTQVQALHKERPLNHSPLLQHRTSLAIGGVVVLFLIDIYLRWKHAPDNLANDALSSLLKIGGAIVAWATVWTLINRMVYGIWNIRIHLAIVSIGCVAAQASNRLLGVAAYSLQWSWLDWFGSALAITCGLIALFMHLRTATELKMRTMAAIALLAPALIVGLAKLPDLEMNRRDVNRVNIVYTVLPPSYLLRQGASLDNYISSVSELKKEAQRKRDRSLSESPIDDGRNIDK